MFRLPLFSSISDPPLLCHWMPLCSSGEGQAGEERCLRWWWWWWEGLIQEGPPSLAELLRSMDGGVQQRCLTTTFTAIEVRYVCVVCVFVCVLLAVCTSALLPLRAARSLLKSCHRCDIYRALPNDLGDCRARTHTHTRALGSSQEQNSVNWRQAASCSAKERQQRCWWGRCQVKSCKEVPHQLRCSQEQRHQFVFSFPVTVILPSSASCTCHLPLPTSH